MPGGEPLGDYSLRSPNGIIRFALPMGLFASLLIPLREDLQNNE